MSVEIARLSSTLAVFDSEADALRSFSEEGQPTPTRHPTGNPNERPLLQKPSSPVLRVPSQPARRAAAWLQFTLSQNRIESLGYPLLTLDFGSPKC